MGEHGPMIPREWQSQELSEVQGEVGKRPTTVTSEASAENLGLFRHVNGPCLTLLSDI